MPETLTADGFKTWEGGCDFVAIEEEVEGRVFVATMTCTDGADEWKEEPAAAGHFAGRLRVFGGQAWKVFEKYDLYYDLTFDAAPVANFKTRR